MTEEMTEKTRQELSTMATFFGHDVIGYIQLRDLLIQLEELEKTNDVAKKGMDAFHEVFRMISLCIHDKSLY